MKTVLYTDIDGHEVVKGFDRPVVDPRATWLKVSDLMKETPEFKSLAEKQAAAGKLYMEAENSMKAAKKAETKKDKAAERKYTDQATVSRGKAEEIEEGIKVLLPEVKAVHAKLMEDNAVHFEPKAGERVITDEEAQSLSDLAKAMPADSVLTTDGEYLKDYRGVIFWKKAKAGWKKHPISKLGDTPETGYKSYRDLTEAERIEIEAQFEAERIAALKPAEKTAEKDAAIASIASRAAGMRSELEVKGEAPEVALEQSQTFYNESVSEVEKLYA